MILRRIAVKSNIFMQILCYSSIFTNLAGNALLGADDKRNSL